MTRPRLLDLFCGAGGAAMGYYRAGFDVVGVDIKPQKHYPFELIQADAMTYPLDGFDAVHASPPCQRYTVLKSVVDTSGYPDLVDETRERLQASGAAWVIENVPGAPLINPVRLCGSSFGIGVRRHRLFESSARITGTTCNHQVQPEPVDVSGTGSAQHSERKRQTGGKCRKPRNLQHAREVMGMPWSDRRGISQAIPPAYTEHIGRQLIGQMQ